MVWMYKCSGDFKSCDGSGSNWFKIDEGGFHGDGKTVFLDTEVNSGWDIAKLMGGNKSWSSNIPAGLAPGNYLIRHELIALHQANNPQWYAECAQLVVGGSGSAQPDASYKAAIPGYAKQSDSNISVRTPNSSFMSIPHSDTDCCSSTSTIVPFLKLTRSLVPRSTRALARRLGNSLLNFYSHQPTVELPEPVYSSISVIPDNLYIMSGIGRLGDTLSFWKRALSHRR